jgi:hypothetical protein
MADDVRVKITNVAVFALPLLFVKVTAGLLGSPGPDAASASGGNTTPPAVTQLGTPPPTWSEAQRAAAEHVSLLQAEPFGPTPMYYKAPRQPTTRPVDVRPPQDTRPDPPPEVYLQAILSAAAGNTAVIGGRYYRVGDPLGDTDWIVSEINGLTRAVTITHPPTDRTQTVFLPTPGE